MISTALVVLSLISLTPAAQAAGPEAVVLETPTRVFVPNGFDSNDNVQVVIEGTLPNLCYKAPFAEVEGRGSVVSITMKAYKTDGLCAMATVPYLETVNLGALPQGNYQLMVNERTAHPEQAELNVATALSSSSDQYVYANLESITKFPGSRRVTLHGSNPADCFKFDRFEVLNNGTDTYSVLPIMRQISKECRTTLTNHFTVLFEVPASLQAKKVLLHVRTMNGKSINSLVEKQ